MKRIFLSLVSLLLISCVPKGPSQFLVPPVDVGTKMIQISRAELLDKLEGGWVGQMAGVAWGEPTEFTCMGKTVENIPQWESWRINEAFSQDDLYVEMPFLIALRERGVYANWTDFGEYFRKTRFMLWHANAQARENLQRGIPPPDSGHYANNPHADDIDWQIEADFAGIISPALPDVAVDIAWRAGHVMNYGDGVYGGVAIAAMHSAAYTAKSISEIIQVGLKSVPVGSQFRQILEDVMQWHRENPSDWKDTWHKIQQKWGSGDRCPEGKNSDFNIDAKLNAAYVFLGLLYGNGDFEHSMEIAMRCGQDSDCNPSSVGGILGNYLGFSGIPEKFTKQLDRDKRFSYTAMTYSEVIDLSLSLARQIVLLRGGRVENTGEDELWHIPVTSNLQPPILEQWPMAFNRPPELSVEFSKHPDQTILVKAQASDADGILDYQWFFGDLTYAFGQEALHTYQQPGRYQVIGYVSDTTGNTSWKSFSIEIEAGEND